MLALVALSGCATSSSHPHGKLIVSYSPSDPARAAAIPTNADYALWTTWPTSSAGGEAGECLIMWRKLNRGEHVGFEKDAANNLVAVMGSERKALPDGAYWWRLMPASRNREMKRLGDAMEVAWERSTERVGQIAAIPVMAVLTPIFYLLPIGGGAK